MLIQEVIDQFLYNRKHGLIGAKGKATPNTLSTYAYALKPFHEFLENDRQRFSWDQVNSADVRLFVESISQRLNDGVWSKARYLITIKVLKGMFKWIETDEDCVEEGLKSFRKKLPVAAKMPRREFIPTPLDLKRWRRSFPTHTYLGMRDWIVFSILLETGMRRAELCSLKLEHLQLENRQIYIPDVVGNKTGSRTIAITAILARSIQLFLKRRAKTKHAGAQYLLSSVKAEVPNPNMVTKLFRRIRNKYGLAHITPHTMRHAFSTYYLKRGGNLERLRNMTGHKSYDALLYYVHLAEVGGEAQKTELEMVSPLKMLDETKD